MAKTPFVSLVLLLALCGAAHLTSGATVDKDGFERLLAGNSLEGWERVGGAEWAVEGGVLAGGPGRGTLMQGEKLRDYVFECEFKLAKGQNSGLFLRVPRRPPRRSLSPRYEIQIWDNKGGIGHRTGDLLYVHMIRQWASKPTEWNRLRLTSVGPRHQIVLNGKLILDAIHFGQLEGHLGFQAHSGGRAPYIWFRELRLKRLPKGTWPHATKLPRVLVLMSAGRRPADAHDRIGQAIENALVGTGRHDVTWAADPRVLDPPHIDEYDAIVLHGPEAKNRTRWLSAPRRARIAERVGAGGGLIVLHSTFRGAPDDWPEFRGLAGGWWLPQDRGPAPKLRITPAAEGHPLLTGVGPFEITDTICRAVGPRPTGTTLLRCEHLGKASTIAWCGRYGRGRTFCCSLGGSDAVIRNPAVTRLLANACAWAAPRARRDKK